MYKIIPMPLQITYRSGFCDFRNAKITKTTDTNLGKEGYSIDISDHDITIAASGAQGFFYAEKTIEQLALQDSIPNGYIVDKPKYVYRGFMLDCCRHFFSVDIVKKYIDLMSVFKLNILHWHLTEDQGFRIEIDKYPKLNQVGSKRTALPKDNIATDGFYTKAQIREVVEYAKARFVDIIPEIGMPGHFSSWIASYPFLSCIGNPIDVKNKYGIFSDIACAGKPGTMEFICNVLDEVIELFPYEYIHLGGDEATKTNWINCPHCQEVIRANNLANEEELQSFFTNQISQYLRSKGKKAIIWNDGAYGGKLDKDITVQYWKEGKEGKEAAKRESEEGKNIILSPFFSFYLDYPYGMTSLKKTYNYNISKSGLDVSANIIGMEAPLWTEYINNPKRLGYMAFPRLLALAERAWSAEEQLDYQSFCDRVEGVKSILDLNGIEYAQVMEANPNTIKGACQLIRFFSTSTRNSMPGMLKRQAEYKKAYRKKYKK